MDGQLVHFEIPAQDGARAMEFWKSLFGWKFRAWDGPVEYHMLDGNEPGGAIYPDPDDGRLRADRLLRHVGHRRVDREGTRARGLGRRQAADPDASGGSRAAWTRRATASRSSSPTSRCRRPASARRRAVAPGRTARAPARARRGSRLPRARRRRGRARCRARSSRPRPRRGRVRARARPAAGGRRSCRRSRPSGASIAAAPRRAARRRTARGGPGSAASSLPRRCTRGRAALSRKPPATSRPSGVCCQ